MEAWLEKLDLDKNGLSSAVAEATRRHRMSDFRISLTTDGSQPAAGAVIELELARHDFKFGSNAFMAGGFERHEHNQRYDEIFLETFNQAVVPFFWKDDEPSRGHYRFNRDSEPRHRRPNPEFMLEWCKAVEVEPKGHSLVWDGSGLPEWLPRTPESLDPALEARIREIARRFSRSIPVWDVINEFLSRSRRSFRKDYHLHYFNLARELFPECCLIANEDTERTWDAFAGDASRFYLYLQHLILSGCKVDGIGMQYHLFSRKEVLHERLNTSLNAENLLACQAFYAQLGRPIHVSEISIPSYNDTGAGEEMQARLTENLYRLWFSGEAVQSIVWWNLVDGYASCLPQWGWDENIYGAGLFRKDMTPKPAFQVIDRLINQEWRTACSLTAGPDGSVAFRGYHGTYKVSATLNGHRQDYWLRMNRETPSQHVTLPH